VRQQDTASPGDIVAAMVEGEATVKRFARTGGSVVLRPEHPTMAAIVVEAGRADVRILGKVVGVIRHI
jgi:repressor LexA